MNDPAVVYYANFKRTGNETRELGLTINGEAKAVEGTTLQFVNGRDVFQAARLLTYVDPANGKSFTTRSGTIRFLKITPVTGPGGQSLTKVSFSLSNVVMVPQNGIETNETFTVNGIGETTLAPPVT
ncbi:hypothetical protein EON80_09460 [bacterium]|nr:MAG: hypothetical protein EON80_09460 [bacterium]